MIHHYGYLSIGTLGELVEIVRAARGQARHEPHDHGPRYALSCHCGSAYGLESGGGGTAAKA